ncbi:hypothetical protein V202x_47770 [Gimesia aquarii]|uniref:Uncharacterized protein n=1 Tax=Gimesia aquarii TaxID=2527964 RepID=A0A517X1H2_9PLAN|nr:hypothetical protein V202x_47770 [Gimesia aquarii]
MLFIMNSEKQCLSVAEYPFLPSRSINLVSESALALGKIRLQVSLRNNTQ